MSKPLIDLYDFRSYVEQQPHDQFDWLRSNEPVFFHPEPNGPGFWAVTGFDDVQAIGRDHERFSSSPTIMIADSESGGGASGDGDGHVMMLMADPPVHTRMRRLVSHRFTPRAARDLTARVEELAEQIVDQVVEAGSCDLVTDLAGEMPSFVIADVLGIPLDDGRRLYHHTEMLHASPDAVTSAERQAALGEMFAYSQQVYADKKLNPSDDLASLLANGSIEDQPVDETDFFLWFLLLVDAGGDTTRNLIGAGMHALLQRPAALAQLRGDLDGLLDSAVEELLRFVSPVVYMRRTATVEVELRGRSIAAGDKVVMFYGAANRDPAVFDDPHTLDLTRSPNPHVSFGGGGPHYCLGAHLARIEIKALMRQIVLRLNNMEMTGPVEWMASNFVFGPTTLPISYQP